MTPMKASNIPTYFLGIIFSFNKILDSKTVRAPLLPVIGEAIEACVYEKLNHKNPVPIMLKSPPIRAYL